jgi:hypothetical protein
VKFQPDFTFYAGALNITNAITQNGRQYQILNLLYYLSCQIEKYIAWFIQTKKASA